MEHPVPVQPIIRTKEEITLELMLTQKERKRIRRQTRANREKEKQEAIQVSESRRLAKVLSVGTVRE